MLKIIFVIIVIMLILALYPVISRTVLAGLIEHDVIPQTSSKWLNYVTRDPVVEHPEISSGDMKLETNLYRPNDGKKHAAIVFIHGVNDLGKDDPRLDNLADTFARSGFVVLVPGFPDMSPGKLNPKVISEIGESIKYIYSRDDLVIQNKIGVLGFSIGSGPAMIAVSRIENQFPVQALISFGGYYDLREVIEFATTGHFSYQGKDYYIQPDYQSRWFFVRYYSDFIQNKNDADILRQMTQMKINDSNADISSLAGNLSPEGNNIYAFITNTDPAKVDQLINGLPVQLQDFINELNPALQVESLPAELYVVHGRNDNVIPYTQSLELYDHFKNKSKAHLYLFQIFTHVNPVFPPITPKNIFTEYVPEIYRFWEMVFNLLRYKT